jgi:hypothetical protein
VAGAEEPFDGDVAFRVIVRPPPMVDVEPLQRPQEARRSELRSAVCSQLEEGESGQRSIGAKKKCERRSLVGSKSTITTGLTAKSNITLRTRFSWFSQRY